MNLSRTIGASFSPTTTKTFLLRSLLLQSSIHSTPLPAAAAAAAAAATKAFTRSKRPSFQIPIPESPPPPPLVISGWPRPSEMPWQPKVANSVKVVGNIAVPIRLDISPNGIYRATSVLSHEKKAESLQFRCIFFFFFFSPPPLCISPSILSSICFLSISLLLSIFACLPLEHYFLASNHQ